MAMIKQFHCMGVWLYLLALVIWLYLLALVIGCTFWRW
jgi:hypothetical protein